MLLLFKETILVTFTLHSEALTWWASFTLVSTIVLYYGSLWHWLIPYYNHAFLCYFHSDCKLLETQSPLPWMVQPFGFVMNTSLCLLKFCNKIWLSKTENVYLKSPPHCDWYTYSHLCVDLISFSIQYIYKKDT